MRRTWTGSVAKGIKARLDNYIWSVYARIFEGLEKSLSNIKAEEVFRQYNKVDAGKPSMTSCIEVISQLDMIALDDQNVARTQKYKVVVKNRRALIYLGTIQALEYLKQCVT